jgi:AcrR family transcriptional regulator
MSQRRGTASRTENRGRKGRETAALEPRKQPRQRRSTQVVDRILDAALNLTREKGTTGPTTLEIATRAGLSVGSVYQYYPNKQAILFDLARRWLSTFPAIIEARRDAAMPGDGTAFRRHLRAYLDDIAKLYLDNAGLLPVLDAMMLDPDLKPIATEYDERIVALYAGWLQRAEPRIPHETAGRLGLLMMEVAHVSMTRGVHRGDAGFALVIDDIERMWLALLAPHLEVGLDRADPRSP